MGVRFLDIRLSKKSDTELEVIHGVADTGRTLDGDMDAVFDFLKNNPSEFIVMSVKQDDDEADDGSNLIAPVFRYSYIDVYNAKYKAITGNDLFYVEDRVPKVSEVRGKIVIIRRFMEEYNGYKAYDDTTIGLNFRNWKDDGWTLKKHDYYYHLIQDCYMLSTSDAVEGANEKIANIDEAFCDIDNYHEDEEYKDLPGMIINFASCYATVLDFIADGVSKYSNIINEYLIDVYEEWENKGVRYGIVPMDFVSKKPDVVKAIYKANLLVSECEHNVESWTVIKESTCTESGLKSGICTKCGNEVKKSIPATGHSCVWEKTVEETCTTQGKKENKCTKCGTITDTEFIPATGHSCVWVKTIVETCLTDGKEENKCSKCNTVIDTKIIPALGHDISYIKEVVDSKECIREKCSRCSHAAYAKVIFSSINLMYDGLAKEPCSIEYSDEWYTTKNVVGAYVNNINAGTATYTMTKDGVVASNNFTILKATTWAVPTGIKKEDASACEYTDKGRIFNVDNTMEYRKESGSYQSISGIEISNLDAGEKGGIGVKYYVRYKETDNHVASNDVEIILKYENHDLLLSTIKYNNKNCIKEYCSKCMHMGIAEPVFSTTVLEYDGTEKEPAHIEYTDSWELEKDVVGTYQNNINAGSASYTLTKGEISAVNYFTIKKATSWPAPTGITKTDASLCKNILSGKISNVDSTMEYRKVGGNYQSISGTEITSLDAGAVGGSGVVYYVRYKETTNHVASSDVVLTIMC